MEAFILDGLALNDLTTWTLEELDVPPPKKRYDRVQGAFTDGSLATRTPRYEMREVSMGLRVAQQSTMDLALSKIAALSEKLQAAEREVAEGQRGLAMTWQAEGATDVLTLYVQGGEVEGLPISQEGDGVGWFQRSPKITVKLYCDPFLYGAEVSITAATSALPFVSVSPGSITGDVPAEGRLIVTDNATQNRVHAEWGVIDDATVNGTTTLVDSDSFITSGFAGTGTTRTGAYDVGGGNTVVRATLGAAPVSVCGLLADSTLIGRRKARVRMYPSAAGTSARLVWRIGDGTPRYGNWYAFPGSASWYEPDLGDIDIPVAKMGAQSMDVWLEAKSTTSGSTLDADYLLLLPIQDGYGKAYPGTAPLGATTIAARDEMDSHAAGSLAGKVAPVGGTWAEAGDADEFQVTTAVAFRSSVSDAAGTPSYMVLGATNYTNVTVNAMLMRTNNYETLGDGFGQTQGVLARYTDTSNWLFGGFSSIGFGSTALHYWIVEKKVAGTTARLATLGPAEWVLDRPWVSLSAWADGRWQMNGSADGNTWFPIKSGSDAALATGGALATGKPGLQDGRTSAVANTRYYSNFAVYQPTQPVTIHSGQSLEFRHDDTLREDSGGTFWGRPGAYRGSRFYLPPTLASAGQPYVAAAVRRVNPDTDSVDNVTDSTTAQVKYTPRWLTVPGDWMLHVEVHKPDGTIYRWDDQDPLNTPQNLSFSTKRMEGFERGSCVLRRDFLRDHHDIELYDDVYIVGDDGTVAYEGRVSAHPRTLDADGSSIQVEFQGHMARMRDRKTSVVYVDRDFGGWDGPGQSARVQSISLGFAPAGSQSVQDPTSGAAALLTEFEGVWANGGEPEVEGWYDAGPGNAIGSVYGAWLKSSSINSATTQFYWGLQLETDDVPVSTNTSGNLRAAGPGSASVTATADTRRFAMVRFSFTDAAGGTGTANVKYGIYWTTLAVYGNHPCVLTALGDGSGAHGVLASEVVAHQAGVAGLQPGTIATTTTPIPHLVFKDRTDPYDICLEANKYHLWSMECWEDKRVDYGPANLRDWDYEVRTDDPGVTLSLQGDSSETLANGITVTYDDVVTRSRKVLTPDTYAELADASPDNPVNRHGLSVWTEVTLSSPTTQAAALALGQVVLAEFNQPKAPGSINATGFVRDRGGARVPAWKVRAGDTVAIADHPNDAPRLVTETSYSHDTVQLTVDQESKRLDAVFDRLATALTAANAA